MSTSNSNQQQRSLKKRLVLQVAGFVAIAMTLVTVLAALLFSGGLSNQVNELLKNATRSSQMLMEQRIAYLVENTERLTENPFIINGLVDPDGRQTYLPKLTESFAAGRNVVSFVLVDFDGRPVFQTIADIPDYNQSPELRIALARGQRTLFIQQPENQMVIVAPIEYYNTTQGAVVAAFDLAAIVRQNRPHNPQAYYRLIKQGVEIVSHNYDAQIQYIKHQLISSEETPLLQALGLELEVGLPEESYLAPVWWAVLRLLAMGALLILAAIFVSAWIGNSIAQPILALHQRVQQSDLFAASHCSPVGTGDELEALALAFDQRTSELQKTVATLQEREHQLRDAQQMAHLGNWSLDIASGELFWSSEIYEIFGMNPKQFTPTYNNFMGTIHPEDHEMVKHAYNEAVTNNRPYEITHRIIRKSDNAVRYVHERSEEIRDENGKVFRSVGMVQDVTDRILAQQEVNAVRHYLQNVFDSMPSILVGVDLDARIINWNSEAQRISGLSQDEALGRDIQQALPMLATQTDRIQQAIGKQKPEKISRQLYTMSGKHRYADIMIYPLMDNSTNGAVIRIDDVTERVRMEEMMMQTEKMMSVGGLAAGMAHEINNPLGGMLQGLQNIGRRLSPDLKRNREVAEALGVDLKKMNSYLEQREIFHFMEGMVDAGKRAADIVANMLRFSRKPVMEFEAVELHELIDRTLELAAVDYDLKKKYDYRNIELVREYDPQLPPAACISSEIQQVLLNLLRNAAQALYRNQERRESTRITIRTTRDGNMARIEVADNGPGIDEETCKRVFEPFFTTRPTGEGTGLGLSVSYFIVHDEHHGQMEVMSEPGKGACFIIKLPLSEITTSTVKPQHFN
ncbi:MAG: PAS domain S-box protein [Candidatus Sedimenticola sp. (ex Thyasira tokunagai)]